MEVKEITASPESPETMPAAPPPVAILNILSGMMTARMVQVAAELGLADLVTDMPRNSVELALAAGAHAGSIRRLMRGLASIGIFAEDENGRFSHTPLSTFLRSNVHGSMRDMARMWGDAWRWETWGELKRSIVTGGKAFDTIYGKSLWEYFAQDNPASGRLFGEAMTSFSEGLNVPVASSYDFSSAGALVDVGGAHGGFLRVILGLHPGLHATLFDLPQVIDGARDIIAGSGFADRIALASGSFLDAVPPGDTYLLKFILQDWDDDAARTILGNCRTAMNPGGRVLIVEMVIPPGNDPFFGKILDIEMMVVLGGKERTGEEFRALLESAGLRLSRIVPAPSSLFSIIEAEGV
jgi:hypothetical protein